MYDNFFIYLIFLEIAIKYLHGKQLFLSVRICWEKMAQVIGWRSWKILVVPLVLFVVRHHAKAHRRKVPAALIY